jgi:hypothetical protein
MYRVSLGVMIFTLVFMFFIFAALTVNPKEATELLHLDLFIFIIAAVTNIISECR